MKTLTSHLCSGQRRQSAAGADRSTGAAAKRSAGTAKAAAGGDRGFEKTFMRAKPGGRSLPAIERLIKRSARLAAPRSKIISNVLP
jgi:hypothetical protein